MIASLFLIQARSPLSQHPRAIKYMRDCPYNFLKQRSLFRFSQLAIALSLDEESVIYLHDF
ncbi:MAG: hypothetical protein JO235_02900 [Chroococcidiopsidaceae cyanobacterium CP_BM_RX_35]|nr:hypothetical protein [Chroococcidiopsidaceae cyanobacterium CP_BM_RX_35]